MMTTDSSQAADVRAALDTLMENASRGRFEILETLYHERMQTYLLDPSRVLHRNDKRGFIQDVRRGTDATTNAEIWAEYHLVEADENDGHVLISRKVNLTGEERIVTLSIDFVHEDGRWQIVREVIFAGGIG